MGGHALHAQMALRLSEGNRHCQSSWVLQRCSSPFQAHGSYSWRDDGERGHKTLRSLFFLGQYRSLQHTFFLSFTLSKCMEHSLFVTLRSMNSIIRRCATLSTFFLHDHESLSLSLLLRSFSLSLLRPRRLPLVFIIKTVHHSRNQNKISTAWISSTFFRCLIV